MIAALGRRPRGGRPGRRSEFEGGAPGRARARRGRRRPAAHLPTLWMMLLGALIGGWLGAFGLTALRNEEIRLRYRLGEAVKAEKALAEERRVLTAHVRRLRDPKRLAEEARRLGFSPPTRVIALSAAGAAPEAGR